jgi:hypothetical protein
MCENKNIVVDNYSFFRSRFCTSYIELDMSFNLRWYGLEEETNKDY